MEDDGPIKGNALQRLAIGTATALTAIHHASIVHRDFKPDNVLIAADGPRVVDFGIARIIDSTGTITSRAIGTPAYMAPEQISGSDVGPYTDVFAWGATIVFAATGETAFAGASIAVVLNRILNHEVDLGVMPEPLRGVVRSALSKSPAVRPSADQILCPSAITASVVQDLTALPSRWTTHAPHCEVSQPTCVPVSWKILTQELNEQRARVHLACPRDCRSRSVKSRPSIFLFSAWRPGFSARGLALKFRGTAWRGQRVFKIVPNS